MKSQHKEPESGTPRAESGAREHRCCRELSPKPASLLPVTGQHQPAHTNVIFLQTVQALRSNLLFFANRIRQFLVDAVLTHVLASQVVVVF